MKFYQKSLQSQHLSVVPAYQAVTVADFTINSKYNMKDSISRVYRSGGTTWVILSFLYEKKSYNLSHRFFSLPSLTLAYCSKDIRKMGSMSHDIKCQACCGGIGCIICLLLAPIRMPGEELCCSQSSQGNCRSVTLWAVQYIPVIPSKN